MLGARAERRIRQNPGPDGSSKRRALMSRILWFVASFSIAVAAFINLSFAAPISMAMVTVGDPGNAASVSTIAGGNGFGAVNYVYQIGKFDVTASQYVAFLNAVAA